MIGVRDTMKIGRVKSSIDARIVQPWIIKHYEKTKYGKELKKLKGIFKNKRCFLIGNGPSLSVHDLDILYENNEITFAFNRIYNIFDETNWRPTFYISQDEKMLAGCIDIVNELDLKYKFIPIQLKWYYGLKVKNAIYFNMLYQQNKDSEDLFSDEIEKEIYCASTGMYTAVQLAIYMGFTEIYFIGVDHHFHISQNNKGEIIVDNDVKDYFTDKYNEDKKDLYIPNVEKSTLTYISIREHCKRHDVKVFNATRGGKLEVFDRIDFDMLFKNK